MKMLTNRVITENEKMVQMQIWIAVNIAKFP